MEIYLLLGEKSAGLKDIDIFCNAFEKNGIKLKKVMTDTIDISYPFNGQITINKEKHPLPDAVISAYFGNINDYNLYVTRYFESMGVLCINTADCIIDARDKLKAILKISQNLPDIKIPDTLLLSQNTTAEFINKKMSFPCIIKIINGSKGIGVELCHSAQEAIKKSKEFKEKYNDRVMLQKYIESSKGYDMRFIICGGKYIVSFIRQNNESFLSNVAKGGEIIPYTPKDEEIKAAQSIASLLNINLGSVDFLKGQNNELIFCEANAMPGLNYTQAFIKAGFDNPLNTIVKNIKSQINNKK